MLVIVWSDPLICRKTRIRCSVGEPMVTVAVAMHAATKTSSRSRLLMGVLLRRIRRIIHPANILRVHDGGEREVRLRTPRPSSVQLSPLITSLELDTVVADRESSHRDRKS